MHLIAQGQDKQIGYKTSGLGTERSANNWPHLFPGEGGGGNPGGTDHGDPALGGGGGGVFGALTAFTEGCARASPFSIAFNTLAT
ncbi:MAG: hypothetical protein JW839_19190, partial [Candidatus Lokiarchaeota archaeon]|nr:hypothetical protein [Candidatus Lokiarchaeota archaeon]